jgi:hypothetical protein
LNPHELNEADFIEQSRNVLWLLNYREERQARMFKEAVLDAYIEVMKAERG